MFNLKSKPLFPALALALCVCAYLLYTFLLACSIRCNSDMANMVLEANDIIHGNFFLKDWVLTGITFFTTDLLFFEIGTLLFGVSNLAYVFALWLMWLSVVAAGCLLFFDSCPKNKRCWLGILFLCFSAFSVPAMAFSRVHAASAAFALMGIFFAKKAARSGHGKHFALSALFLVLATAGDILGLLTAVLPVALVYSVKSFRTVAYEGGRVRNRHTAVAIMAVCSLFVALVLERLWLAAGGADKNSYIGEKLFLQVREWPEHLGVYLDGLFVLLDAHFMGEPLSGPYALVKLCRSLAVLAGFCIMGRNVWRFFRGRDCDETIILVGLSFFAVSLAYIITPLSIDRETTRYFAYAPVPFALAISCHVASIRPSGMKASVRHGLKAGLAACSFLFILASVKHNRVSPRILFDGDARRQACYDVPRLELAEFLEEQGLTSGYATFWNASIISVYTNNRVRVRQINSDGSQNRWFCKNSWYGEYADFIVTNQLDKENIKLNFSGGGYKSLIYNDFEIFVFDHDIALMGKRPRSYNFAGQNLTGGYDEGGRRFLRPGGTSYGPYWPLLPGKYRVFIAGENLGAAELEVYSDFGERQHPFVGTVSGEEILLEFSLGRAVPNLEVVVRNGSAQEMSLSSLVIAPADE